MMNMITIDDLYGVISDIRLLDREIEIETWLLVEDLVKLRNKLMLEGIECEGEL